MRERGCGVRLRRVSWVVFLIVDEFAGIQIVGVCVEVLGLGRRESLFAEDLFLILGLRLLVIVIWTIISVLRTLALMFRILFFVLLVVGVRLSSVFFMRLTIVILLFRLGRLTLFYIWRTNMKAISICS